MILLLKFLEGANWVATTPCGLAKPCPAYAHAWNRQYIYMLGMR
ncbi:hypothetical protein GYH30_039216 [Glycine max]|nr:hypothetical protein GYH30_039216 [Glycine max]